MQENNFNIWSFSLRQLLRFSNEEIMYEHNRYKKFFFDIDKTFKENNEKPINKYILATTSRVGGHWLGQMLYGTGCSQPEEWLSDYHLQRFLEEGTTDSSGKKSLCDYWNKLFSHAKENHLNIPTFGIKVNLPSILPFLENANFPCGIKSWKFIYLYRNDVISQGISLYIARKANSWNSFEGQEKIQALSESDCNLDEIINDVQCVCNERLRWDLFFALVGINPLRIAYEDLMIDALAQVSLIRKHLELNNDNLLFREYYPLKKQETQLYSTLRKKIEHSLITYCNI